jgi:hypothetical protein
MTNIGSTKRSEYVLLKIYMKPRSEHDVLPTWALPSTCKERFIECLSDDEVDAEDGDFDFPYREVEAFAWLTSEELQGLRNEWDLYPEGAEPALGFLGDLGDGPKWYDDERHCEEGDGWNIGGVTPVLWCDVSIIGPHAKPA